MKTLNQITNIVANNDRSERKTHLFALHENSDFQKEDILKLGEFLGIESKTLDDAYSDDFGVWVHLNQKFPLVVYIPGEVSVSTKAWLIKLFEENEKELVVIYHGDKSNMVLSNRSIWVGE